MARKAKDRSADSRDGRTPPEDPSGIVLTYHHEHLWWYSADDAPERWHISADICDDSGHPEIHVGDIGIVIVDLNETRDPFSLLDGESADLGHIAGVVFGPGSSDLDPELDEQLEVFGGRLLILDTVRLTPQWRGFGLGVLLAGTAIKKLSADARLAACYPGPLDDNPDPATEETPEDEAARRRAVAALGRTWARLGFEPFRDGVHVLDFGLATFEENLSGLRQSAQGSRSYDGQHQ
jgi:hypothetical protein